MDTEQQRHGPGEGAGRSLRRGLPQAALVVSLFGLLAVQTFLINPPPKTVQVGDLFPFVLTQEGQRIDKLPFGCSVGFIVNTSCSHCARLAEAFSFPAGGGVASGTEPPVWIVLGGMDAELGFSAEHDLPKGLVFGALPSRRWKVFSQDVYVPFTPMRIILDGEMVVRDMSQSQEILAVEELEEKCPPEPLED